MFFFTKNGRYFSSFITVSLNGETEVKPIRAIETKFGIFLPLDEKSTNLIDYFQYGKKAVFVSNRKALNGILIGCDFKLHHIRASNTEEEINIDRSTYVLDTPEIAKNFNLLIAPSNLVYESLRVFVYGSFSIPKIIKVLKTIGPTAGSFDIAPTEWKKGEDLFMALNLQKDAEPLFNPDYKP